MATRYYSDLSWQEQQAIKDMAAADVRLRERERLARELARELAGGRAGAYFTAVVRRLGALDAEWRARITEICVELDITPGDSPEYAAKLAQEVEDERRFERRFESRF